MTAGLPLAAGVAPGVVKVRLSGAAQDIEVVAGLLAGAVIEESGQYPNRRDPGVRVYLTVLAARGAEVRR
jgi:hypothetical protein